MQKKNARAHESGAPGVIWAISPMGEAEAPEAYRIELGLGDGHRSLSTIEVPAAVLARGILERAKLELMVDIEDGGVLVAGEGLSDAFLDALARAFSDIQLLNLAAASLEGLTRSRAARQFAEDSLVAEGIERLTVALAAFRTRKDQG